MRAKPSKVAETMYSNKNMADIVVTAKDLDMNSKIELFSFMSSMGISYMENTNGIFFSLTNLTDTALQDIRRKLDELKSYETISNQQFAMSKLSEDFENSGYASDKSESFLEEQGTGCQQKEDIDADVPMGIAFAKNIQTKAHTSKNIARDYLQGAIHECLNCRSAPLRDRRRRKTARPA